MLLFKKFFNYSEDYATESKTKSQTYVKRKLSKGFTLMELIIVLGILLTLYAAFKPNKKSRDSAVVQSVAQQVDAIRSAMELCIMRNGQMNYTNCVTGATVPNTTTTTKFTYYLTNNADSTALTTPWATNISFSVANGGQDVTITIPTNNADSANMLANMLRNKAKRVTVTGTSVAATY